MTGYLDRQKLQYFVDSGSNISLVSSNWITANGLTKMCTSPDIAAKSLTNHHIPITGQVTLHCKIAGHESQQNFYVCQNLPYDSLLGTDSLFSKQLMIDFSNKQLVSKHGSANFIFAPSPINFVNHIRLTKNTTFEPNKIYFTEAQIVPKNKHDCNTLRYRNFEGIFEPSNPFKFNENLIIARSINHSDNGLIKLQITNISNAPVTIQKSRKLGQLHSIDTNFTHAINVDHNPSKESDKNDQSRDDIISQLKIDSNNHITPDQKATLKKLMSKYSQVLSTHRYDVGSVNMPDIDTSINLIPGSRPKFIPERKIPHHQKPIMQKLIDEMVQNNIAEPCEYSEWNSPLICVAKKGSTPENPQYRACVDLRYLNSCTVKDSYSVPNANNIFSQLKGAKYFSTFDITSGYHNIPLDKASRPLTAFMFNNQQYMFKTLPQGAKNSGSKFCRVIDKLFGKIPFTQIFAYIDDILICSHDFDSHIKKLDFVLNTLQSNGLKINVRKATLCKPNCEFIGYNLSANGVSMSDFRLEAIRKLTPPTDFKSTQKFCGFVNYVRNHCRNFATTMKPIYELLDKNKKWEWTSECQTAYDNIIETLLRNTVLHHPIFDNNPENRFSVSVDSCSQGWGGMLEQMQNGTRVLISYWSKTMPKLKRELGSTRQEFIGIYHIVKHFRDHLLGKSFDIFTDCRPLLAWEKIFNKGSSVQMRQINYLSEFDFNILHVEGSTHVIPDYFSRQCLSGVSIQTQTLETSLSDIPKLENEQQITSTTPANVFAAQVTHNPTKFLTLSEITQAQKEDQILSIVRKWVSDGKLPDSIQVVDTPPELLCYFKQFEKLSIINDTLYRTWDDKNGDRNLIVLPSSLIETCLKQCHSSLESPHFGIDITLDKIRERFYFHNMKPETKLFVDGCITCARVKQPKSYQKPPLTHINIYQDLNDGLIIDHIGPLPVTEMGNKYILTCVDFFTGYVVANACKSTTSAETIQTILNQWVTKFGFPKNCHHDLGTSFTSKLFQAFLAYFDIESKKGQPYSPTTQGKVESWNKKLKTVFQTVLNPDKCNDWDKYLNLVTFALNSQKQLKTGFSANKLVYGRELNQPSQILLHDPKTALTVHNATHNTAAYKVHRTINNIMHKTRKTINAMNKYSKTHYDKSANFKPFEVNDQCLILKHVTKHKYQAKWLGPFKVIQCITPYLYKIQLDDGSHKVVNIKIMKKFTPTKYTPSTINPKTPAVQVTPPTNTQLNQSHDDVTSDSDNDDDQIEITKVCKTIPSSSHKQKLSREHFPVRSSSKYQTEKADHTPSHNETNPTIITPTQTTTRAENGLQNDIHSLINHMKENPITRPRNDTHDLQTLDTITTPVIHDQLATDLDPPVVIEPTGYQPDPVINDPIDVNNDSTLSQNIETGPITDNGPLITDTGSLNAQDNLSDNARPNMTFTDIPPRRSTRTKTTPDYLKDYIVGLLSITGDFISQSLM